MTFEEWLQYGIDHEFCGNPHCFSHDTPEMTSDEVEIWEEDGEVCLQMVRLY
jgi:hypothetical protein